MQTGASGKVKTLKIKMTIAYDGTHYAGWQAQKTGLGVQQRIEEALHQIFGGTYRLHSSSRTDTGVHALGLVAHVEIPPEKFKMPFTKFPLALNACLPPDIRIMAAAPGPAAFHARFDACGKRYRYFVWNHHALNPLLRHQAWLVPHPLDLNAMRAAAQHLLGRHDFAAFAGTRNYRMKSTVRTLSRCGVKRSGPLLTFTIEGDGFLYKMCRGIVGTLVQVGQGKIAVAEMERILASRDRRAAGMTAPAQGLVLWKVFYHKRRSSRGGEARDKARTQDPQSAASENHAF